MSFWNSTFLGAQIWLWGCLVLTFLGVGGALLYFFREIVIEKWLKFRWPEKCIEICIHYPGIARYNSYWRLIPNPARLDIDNKIYRYDNTKQIWEDSDILAKTEGEELGVWVNGTWRIINTDFLIRKKYWKWPQLHYLYNCPEPMNFNTYTTEKGFNASGDSLNQIVKSDLWSKALDLKGQNAMLLIIIIMVGLNLLMGLFTLAKVMGWIKN